MRAAGYFALSQSNESWVPSEEPTGEGGSGHRPHGEDDRVGDRHSVSGRVVGEAESVGECFEGEGADDGVAEPPLVDLDGHRDQVTP